jgi:hypothetical protein
MEQTLETNAARRGCGYTDRRRRRGKFVYGTLCAIFVDINKYFKYTGYNVSTKKRQNNG